METTNIKNMETESRRMSKIYISPDIKFGIITVMKLAPWNILGKTNYYYNNPANNQLVFNSSAQCSEILLETLGQSYQLPVWEKDITYSDDYVNRFGFNNEFTLSKYFYSIIVTHDLENNTVTLDPYKWDNGYQEGVVGMKSFTVPYGDKEALEKAIRETVSYLETYSPISEKYRTFPLNRRKIIEKWRKDNPNDPRTKLNIEMEQK